ncbi:histidine phosphatase family protein [Planktothrix agardhii 1806]|nr:histidine phosphatase family protein [Planktothrix agardhii 1806]
MARRSSQVIQEIEERYPSGNILIVSHKATIRIMLCELLGIDIGRFRDRIVMPTGAVSIVELSSRGPLLHTLADRCHLDETLRSSIGT